MEAEVVEVVKVEGVVVVLEVELVVISFLVEVLDMIVVKWQRRRRGMWQKGRLWWQWRW